MFKTKCQSEGLLDNISQTMIDRAIGVVLTNSRDWNKGRVNKTNNDITEADNVEDNTVDDDEDEGED